MYKCNDISFLETYWQDLLTIDLLRFIDITYVKQLTLIISFDPSTNPMKMAFSLLIKQMRILNRIVASLGLKLRVAWL